jgi:hypothetical protein
MSYLQVMLLVVERVNDKDETHYATALELDRQSRSPSTYGSASDLLPRFLPITCSDTFLITPMLNLKIACLIACTSWGWN